MMAWAKDVEHDFLYNKRWKDNKDSPKRDRAWLELSKHVDVSMKMLNQWFSHAEGTLYRKLSHIRSGQGRQNGPCTILIMIIGPIYEIV